MSPAYAAVTEKISKILKYVKLLKYKIIKNVQLLSNF